MPGGKAPRFTQKPSIQQTPTGDLLMECRKSDRLSVTPIILSPPSSASDDVVLPMTSELFGDPKFSFDSAIGG